MVGCRMDSVIIRGQVYFFSQIGQRFALPPFVIVSIFVRPRLENTIFNIASLSKMPCTTAIMLLNHTSGLPGTIEYGVGGTTYNKEFAKDFLEVLSKSHLKHKPGEMAPYCNDGFTLAEILVAKVAGKNYIDFLMERVFKPLGLKNTGSSVGVRQLEKGVIAAKVYTSDGMSEMLEVVSSLGGGGLSSTAVDLCKFGDSFTNGGTHILSSAALAEMNKRQPAEYNGKLRHPDSGNGLGWDYTEIPRFEEQGIKVVGKGGDTHYHSMLFLLPEKRITVAVIAAVLDTYLAEKGYYVQEPTQVSYLDLAVWPAL